jgi:hypothetical protein
MGKGRSQVVAAFGWGHSNTVITERSHGEKMGDSAVRTRGALEAAGVERGVESGVEDTRITARVLPAPPLDCLSARVRRAAHASALSSSSRASSRSAGTSPTRYERWR